MTDEYAHMREIEDNLIRDMINSSASTIAEPAEPIEKTFDPFEEHCCKGGFTETWLIPGGSEFWLISNTEPKSFTWIEYCPYCGYHPPNLRLYWGNTKIPDPPFKIEGTAPVKDAYFKEALGRHDFPISSKSTEYP